VWCNVIIIMIVMFSLFNKYLFACRYVFVVDIVVVSKTGLGPVHNH